MIKNNIISSKERSNLRELAKKQLEYSNLPIMKERTRQWYSHNSLKGEKPMVVMEMNTFESDMLPPLKCETEAARNIETELLRSVIGHEMIDDDKVVAPYHVIYQDINCRISGLDISTEHAEDSNGRTLGYHKIHPIKDLINDWHLLKPSEFSFDKDSLEEQKAFVEDILGDILPIRIKNRSLEWHMALTARIIDLMGMETMLFSMVDYPEKMHELMSFLRDDLLAFAKWQEKERLLLLNNENDYTGAGSYGFTNELPTAEFEQNSHVTTKDLWVNMNSQESVGISPDMFGEFIFPYYQDIAREFGLVYYGCCEPVHDIWKDYIGKLQGLRKVSISPWCNEEIMGEALSEGKVIYSRKPSPNFVGVSKIFDEKPFRAYIEKTLKAASGCKVEFIFRDIYTLNGDKSKPGKAVKITRELIEKLW